MNKSILVFFTCIFLTILYTGCKSAEQRIITSLSTAIENLQPLSTDSEAVKIQKIKTIAQLNNSISEIAKEEYTIDKGYKVLFIMAVLVGLLLVYKVVKLFT